MNQVESVLVRNPLEVFNERNSDVRLLVLEELWHDEGVFIDADAAHYGKAQMDEAVVGLIHRFENFEFSVNGPIRAYHGVGCRPTVLRTIQSA